MAKASFAFLDRTTTAENIFWPVGNSDWYPHGEAKSPYDQQPVEAVTMADAALTAFDLLGEEQYLAAFRRALALQPKFLPALQGAAQLEYYLHDPNCRKTLEALLKVRADPTVHAMLGVLAFEAKDWAAALNHFDSAGDAANQPSIKWQRATCDFQIQDWEPAARYFRELDSQTLVLPPCRRIVVPQDR